MKHRRLQVLQRQGGELQASDLDLVEGYRFDPPWVLEPFSLRSLPVLSVYCVGSLSALAVLPQSKDADVSLNGQL